MSDGSHPPQRFQRAKVTLENGVHVTARRQGRSALILELNVERNRQAVGWLNYDGGKREFEIPRGTTLFVKPSEAGNESFIIPIRGQMWIGDEVTAGVDDILLEGAAAIIEESLWGGRFVAKTEPLTIGDAVTIVGASGDIAIGEGFVFVGENSEDDFGAMKVTIQAVANYAIVNRAGSLGYRIRSSVWSRISADPVAAFFIAIVSFFFTLYQLCNDRNRGG